MNKALKPIFKVLLCICALSVSGAGAAYAGPFEDGEAAYNRGDYATALKLWRHLADQGKDDAQFSPRQYARQWGGRY